MLAVAVAMGQGWRPGSHGQILHCDRRRVRDLVHPVDAELAAEIVVKLALVADGVEAVIRGLKAELAGEIEVGGPDLAQSLTEAGLIDEYRLYLRPVVLGGGQPFFAGPRPPLRLVASDLLGEDAIRLTYVPA